MQEKALKRAIELLKEVSNFVFDLDMKYNGERDYLTMIGYPTLENDIDDFLDEQGETDWIKN